MRRRRTTEYRVEGMIRFHPTSKLKLGETLRFNSPFRAQVTLNPASDDNLSVQITLEADDPTTAKEMAGIELDRTCNLLSYLHEFPISKSRITAVHSEHSTPKGKDIRLDVFLSAIDTVASLVKELDPKSAEELRHQLEKVYPVDFENVISTWRQAISTESPALKYILLYRLVEFLFSNKGKAKTRAFTDWIKKKEPSVNMNPPDEYRNYHYTHYTYLRDNIHAKTKLFPRTEIVGALPMLQRLTKQAIEEKFGFH